MITIILIQIIENQPYFFNENLSRFLELFTCLALKDNTL